MLETAARNSCWLVAAVANKNALKYLVCNFYMNNRHIRKENEHWYSMLLEVMVGDKNKTKSIVCLCLCLRYKKKNKLRPITS